MLTKNSLVWLLLAPLLLVGCWSNTIWIESQDPAASPVTSITLVPSGGTPPNGSPYAILEAKGIKTWDSPGDLLGSNVEKAKELGASHIWCPAKQENGTFGNLVAFPVPSKEEISLLKDFIVALTDLVKSIIAFPVTFRSEAISTKTQLCAIYRVPRKP